MMNYNYTCKKPEEERCKIKDLPEEFFDGKLDLSIAVNHQTMKFGVDGIDQDSVLVWIHQHGMGEQPDVKCPACNGPARRSIQKSESYIKGNCYLDTVGCRRDMNLYKLQKDDPYGYMRQPGEKDDMVAKLKKSAKKGGSSKTRTYIPAQKTFKKPK